MSQRTAFLSLEVHRGGRRRRRKNNRCVHEIIYLVNMCLDEKKNESTRGTESTRLNINSEEVRRKNKSNMDHFQERS